MALSRCTTLPADVFLRDVFGHQHLHTAAEELDPGEDAFADLFSAQALEEMLTRGLRTSSLRLVQDGVEMPVTAVDAPGADSPAGEAGFADTDALRTAIAAGQTLIIRSLHRLHPPIRRFAHQLALDLGHPVGVNAFITPAHSVGVDLHFDVQDVLVLQVTGEKTWVLRTAPLPDPLPADAWFDVTSARRQKMLDASAPLDKLAMRPGDTLYFPRGTFHAPQTGDSLSIHLTFAITKITHTDVLTSLLTPAAAADPWLRESIDPADLENDPAAARSLVAHLTQALTSAARSIDPGDLLWAVRQAAFAGPPEPSPVLPAAAPATAYRLRDNVHYRVEQETTHCKVSAGNRSVRLPSTLGPVLQGLHDDRRLNLDDLDELVSADTALQTVRALVEIGVLLPLGRDGSMPA